MTDHLATNDDMAALQATLDAEPFPPLSGDPGDHAYVIKGSDIPVPNFAEGLPPQQMFGETPEMSRARRDEEISEVSKTVEGSIFASPWYGKAEGRMAGTLFEPNWHPAVNAEIDRTLGEMLDKDAEEAAKRLESEDDFNVQISARMNGPQVQHYVAQRLGTADHLRPSGGGNAAIAQQLAAIATTLASVSQQLASVAEQLASPAAAPVDPLIEEVPSVEQIVESLSGVLMQCVSEGHSGVEMAAIVQLPDAVAVALIDNADAVVQLVHETVSNDGVARTVLMEFIDELRDLYGSSGLELHGIAP